MFPGDTLQLRSNVSSSRSRVVNWTTSNSQVARVNSNGIVEARAAGSVTISARGINAIESTPIRVSRATAVTLTSSKPTLSLAEQVALTVSVRTDDGRDLVPRSVAWSVSQGTSLQVNNRGVVVAVGPGSSTIRAVVGGTVGLLPLTVQGIGSDPGTPIVSSFAISPKTVTIAANATAQFATTTVWSDGLPHQQTVTYQATGGTINVNGLYTAGQAAGAFMVIATCSCGKADTAAVTLSVTAPPLAMTAMQVSPRTVTLQPSTTQQFSVTPTWNDGLVHSATFSYQASAGSVTAGGLYTAPASAGIYQVIASHVGGTLKDTATVVVSSGSGTPSSTIVAELPRVYLDATLAAARAAAVTRTINVANGNALQAALDTSKLGDNIVLQPGVTYSGSFYLRKKSTGTGWITIRSGSASLPPAGTRIRPTNAAVMPRLVSPTASNPVIITDAGAHHYRFLGLEITANSSATFAYALVSIHSFNTLSTASEDLPNNIIFDRVYVHGTPTLSFQRCLLLNGASTIVVDSWISECHAQGGDSQAILAYHGTGPYKIENNYIEGAAENILFGGADNASVAFIPADIEIRGNHIAKPATWEGGIWTIKNLIELKVGKRVLIEGNVLENNWAASQAGFAIVLKSVNQSGSAPWSETRDITIRSNVVKNIASALAASGAPESYPAIPMSRVNVVGNSFEAVGSGSYAGGVLLQLADVADFIYESNTGIGATRGIGIGFTGLARLRIVDNVVGTLTPQYDTWDFALYSFGEQGYGTSALNAHATAWTVSNNIMPGVTPSKFPSGNIIPSGPTAVGFVSFPTNLELSSSSPYRTASSKGTAPGADFVALRQLTAGVVVTP